ncbi:MAG: hypothetical protein ABSC37_03530 [Xanthobacteraceae bacterium]|jgi:hypothetical protein
MLLGGAIGFSENGLLYAIASMAFPHFADEPQNKESAKGSNGDSDNRNDEGAEHRRIISEQPDSEANDSETDKALNVIFSPTRHGLSLFGALDPRKVVRPIDRASRE